MPKGELDHKGLFHKGKLVPAEGIRKDGRNLIQEWMHTKSNMDLSSDQYQFVNSSAGLKSVNYSKVKYLLGLFNSTNMEYEQVWF